MIARKLARLPSFLPCIAAGTLLALAMRPGPAEAQTPPPPAAPAEAPTPPPPAGLDLTLLKRALAPLAADTVLESRSTIQITGSKQGVSFTLNEQANILSKRPGKFRADITQNSADASPQRRLSVVSDGVKVWTCSLDAHQYAVMTAKAFNAANDDMTALGLAQGGFFLGEGHEMAQGLSVVTKDNSSQVLQMLAGMGIQVTGKTESLNNEDDFVYRLVVSKQGIAYRFFIDTATAKLRRIELTGQQNGVTVAFQETISELKAPAVVDKSAFRFTPPPGTTKVAALSVDPF